MVLKPELLDAFIVLGLPPESDHPTTIKAYKKLALIHHPDRNHNDPTATERFQQIGAAWDICQRHFDNPSWGHLPDPSSAHTYSSGVSYNFSKDDDIPLDEDELRAFYKYMFMETLLGYRYERSGAAGDGVFTFSGGFAESQARQANNTERQRRANEEYEKRKRELELEIEEEERERQKLAKKLKADEDRRTIALEHAFRDARAGNSLQVQKCVLDYDLDVNVVRRRGKQNRKQEDPNTYDTLLHVAASYCDGSLVMFLVERGANTTMLNQDQLTPFHAAIKAGNIRVVHFIMEHRGKSFESYHPSKAAPSGRTPLQLAIESRVPAMVELLLNNATTHDVERCWKLEFTSEEIKQILRRKKGFVPPEDTIDQDYTPLVSKKSLRQQRLAEQKAQKEARVTEELRRAAINRQKKEERAAKRAAQECEQTAARLAQEEVRYIADIAERQQLEDIRKVQEAEKLARELDEICLKAEAEKLQKTEAERRVKVETMRAKVQAERPVKTANEPPAKIRIESKESRLPFARTRPQESIRHPDVSTASAPPASIPSSNGKPPTEAKLTEAEQGELRRTKLREKRKAKQAAEKLERHSISTVAPEQPVLVQVATAPIASDKKGKKPKSLKLAAQNMDGMDEAQQAKYEAALRRRTEQSIRDKERHRQMLAERKKTRNLPNREGSPEYIPLTPVSTHTARKDSSQKPMPPRSSDSFSSVTQTLYSTADSLNLMAVEEIQTCIVPDDLFRDEKPSVPTRQAYNVQCVQPSSVQAGPEEPGGSDRANKRPYGFPRRGRVAKLSS